MNTTALPVREALPGVDPVADARFMLAHPDVAHSPLHCRQIVAGLLARLEKAPLTDEQISAVIEEFAGGVEWSDADYESGVRFARAIEAAHGITQAQGSAT